MKTRCYQDAGFWLMLAAWVPMAALLIAHL